MFNMDCLKTEMRKGDNFIMIILIMKASGQLCTPTSHRIESGIDICIYGIRIHIRKTRLIYFSLNHIFCIGTKEAIGKGVQVFRGRHTKSLG